MKGITLPTGENVPDYPRPIRWAMHYLTGLGFLLVPTRWMDLPRHTRRYRIWSEVVRAYGWWRNSQTVSLRQVWRK